MDLTIMYVTIMPVILGGIGNMIFTKTQLYKKYSKPMDGGKILTDGKPILGENKTWIGFVGMIVITGLAQLLWGSICYISNIEPLNQLYNHHDNTLIFNITLGITLGFAYVICEIPNSFIKRRLNIRAGKTERGIAGVIFFFVDQFDSIIGVAIIIGIVAKLSIGETLVYIVLGGITHILVNLLLFTFKIRKNI